jgi:hypothetical protein
MVMVVMAAGAMLLVVVLVIVVMTATAVFFVVMLVIVVMTAATVSLVVMLVVMVMTAAAVFFVVMLVVMVMTAAAVSLVVMLVMFFLQCSQCSCQGRFTLQGLHNLRSGQILPRSCNNGSFFVMLPEHSHGVIQLLLGDIAGTGENNGRGGLNLIVVEFAKVFHVDFHLAGIHNSYRVA